MKQMWILLLMVGTIGTVLGQSTGSIQPANGFVPDEQTANRVGTAIMTAVLGKRYLDDKKPVAKLDGDVWTITFIGKYLQEHPNALTTGAPAAIQLSRKDGHVIAAWHAER